MVTKSLNYLAYPTFFIKKMLFSTILYLACPPIKLYGYAFDLS